MKPIGSKEIERVKTELAVKRNEFEQMNFNSLDEKLKWIEDFFNSYVPMLEERYLSEEERKGSIFLPNELRIHFYMYFPEHGLNQANNCQELAGELAKIANSRSYANRFAFSHWD